MTLPPPPPPPHQATLAQAQAEADRLSQVARIESQMAAKARSEELNKDVYKKHQAQQLEELRSSKLVAAQVAAEARVAAANGEAEAIRALAEAHLVEKQREADGIRAVYDAQVRHRAGCALRYPLSALCCVLAP